MSCPGLLPRGPRIPELRSHKSVRTPPRRQTLTPSFLPFRACRRTNPHHFFTPQLPCQASRAGRSEEAVPIPNYQLQIPSPFCHCWLAGTLHFFTPQPQTYPQPQNHPQTLTPLARLNYHTGLLTVSHGQINRITEISFGAY